MSKKLINTYVKYTAKKPVLFFVMILVGVLSIVILSLSTKTNIVITYDGTVEENEIIINGDVDSYTGSIYAYSDRNVGMYSVEITETIHRDGKTIFLLKDDNEYILLMNQQEIKIDIPIHEITIFERVLLKGGKVNG